MKNITNLNLLICFFLPSLAMAQVTSPSAASMDLSANGVSQIVQGSSKVFAAGSQLTIVAIDSVGDFVDITLRSIAHSATVTIRVSKQVLGHSLIATGQMVRVIGFSGGNLVYAAGQLLAFLPNELGKSLLYSQKI